MSAHQAGPFAELLKRHRLAVGYSHKALAEKATMSERGVSDLERGARLRPRLETVRLLADALALAGADRAAFFAAARGIVPDEAGDHQPVPAGRVNALPSVPGVPASPKSDPPHNVPTQTTPFVGRTREVSAIRALLRRDDVRLVTLTGLGGIGKTRLSLHTARQMLDAFPDGVWVVRLAHLADPHLVVPEIARAFGLQEAGPVPIAQVLCQYLREKRLLLVLDNFEHLMLAATALVEILAQCPNVKILVTSRMLLRLSMEHAYPLRPLPLPDVAHLPSPQRIFGYPGVALFVARAKAARADVEISDRTAPIIARICAQLDGLPLAIELAASRMNVLSPVDLLKRMGQQLSLLTHGTRDADERHQTMRHALAWSYTLLSPSEQRLFRRLAVFAGGCTVEAVEATAAAPSGGVRMLDDLGALVEHSLLQQRGEEDSVRFSMLRVVREYAQEELDAHAEAEEARLAHAEWCLAYAEAAWQGMRDHPSQEPLWLDALDVEWDNLRAALTWAVERERTGMAVRLAVALGRYWYLRGYYRDGLRWFERIFALPAIAPLLRAIQERPSPEPARVLGAGSHLAADGEQNALARAIATALNDGLRFPTEMGCLVQYEHWVRASLALSREVGSGEDEVRALVFHGFLAAEQHHPLAEAIAYVRCALRRAHALGDPGWIGACLSNLAAFARASGDLAAAETHLREALDWQRRNGRPHGIARQLTSLAQLALDRGDVSQAWTLARESLTTVHATNDPAMLAELLVVLAASLAYMGHARAGARLLGAAVAASKRIGEHLSDEDAARVAAAIERLRTTLGEKQWADALARGARLSLEEAIASLDGDQVSDHSTVQGVV